MQSTEVTKISDDIWVKEQLHPYFYFLTTNKINQKSEMSTE